jgi:hypothetical protein
MEFDEHCQLAGFVLVISTGLVNKKSAESTAGSFIFFRDGVQNSRNAAEFLSVMMSSVTARDEWPYIALFVCAKHGWPVPAAFDLKRLELGQFLGGDKQLFHESPGTTSLPIIPPDGDPAFHVIRIFGPKHRLRVEEADRESDIPLLLHRPSR